MTDSWLETIYAQELERRGKRPHYPKPESEQQAREWMKEIISRLRELSFPTSPFSDKQRDYLIGAFEIHLNGGVSLDIALGLRAGTKRTPEKHKALADDVEACRKAGKTWDQIAEALHYDKRELQKIHRRHSWLFLVDDIGARMAVEDKAERWARKLRGWRMHRMLLAGRTMAECESDPELSLDTLTKAARLRFGLKPDRGE